MDILQENEMWSAAKETQKILEELYAGLDGGSPEPEAVARLLQKHFPWTDPEKLAQELQELWQGLEEGRADLDKLLDLPEEELERTLTQPVRERLDAMDPEERRQYMIILVQMLYGESGYKVDGNLAVYFSNLPDREIWTQISFIAQELGAAAVGEIAGKLDDCLQDSQEQVKVEQGDSQDYPVKERERILAAAVYAATSRSKPKAVSVSTLGRKLGIERSLMEKLGKAMRQQILPLMFRLLMIAAAVAAAYLLWHLLAASEMGAMLVAYLQKNHLIQYMAITAVPVIVGAIHEFCERVMPFQAVDQAVENGVDATSRLDQFFAHTQELADQDARARQAQQTEDLVLDEEPEPNQTGGRAFYSEKYVEI